MAGTAEGDAQKRGRAKKSKKQGEGEWYENSDIGTDEEKILKNLGPAEKKVLEENGGAPAGDPSKKRKRKSKRRSRKKTQTAGENNANENSENPGKNSVTAKAIQEGVQMEAKNLTPSASLSEDQVKQMVGALNSLDKSLKTDEQGAAKEEDQSEKTKRARKRANKKRNTRQRQLEEELNLPGSAEKDVRTSQGTVGASTPGATPPQVSPEKLTGRLTGTEVGAAVPNPYIQRHGPSSQILSDSPLLVDNQQRSSPSPPSDKGNAVSPAQVEVTTASAEVSSAKKEISEKKEPQKIAEQPAEAPAKKSETKAQPGEAEKPAATAASKSTAATTPADVIAGVKARETAQSLRSLSSAQTAVEENPEIEVKAEIEENIASGTPSKKSPPPTDNDKKSSLIQSEKSAGTDANEKKTAESVQESQATLGKSPASQENNENQENEMTPEEKKEVQLQRRKSGKEILDPAEEAQKKAENEKEKENFVKQQAEQLLQAKKCTPEKKRTPDQSSSSKDPPADPLDDSKSRRDLEAKKLLAEEKKKPRTCACFGG